MLGIDDFSFRKGQVFGSILIDGESREVVDLLPDCTAETAAAWLKQRPGVEIVTRDRSADYTRAVTTGAPQALQIADRFHLAMNAGEALERVVQRHHQGLRSAARAIDQEHVQQTASAAVEAQPLPPPQGVTDSASEAGSPARHRRQLGGC